MKTALPDQRIPLHLWTDQESTTHAKRDYISYSQIRTYQACPLKHHFQYVERAEPEQLSAAMLVGTAVHAAVQAFYEAVLAKDPALTIETLIEVYRRKWSQEAKGLPIQFAKGQDVEVCEASARKMIEAFLGSEFAAYEGQIVGIEEGFRIRLDANLPDLVGRVDFLTHHEGVLTVTDFKTARTIPSEEASDDQSDQLVLYAEGCRAIAEELKATIRLRFIYISKTKEPKVEKIEVSADTNRQRRTLSVIKQVYKAIQAGIAYPAPSPISCTGCAYRRRCASWNNL